MLRRINNFLFNNISIKQTVVKNTFWLLLAEGVSKLIAFIITILIARYLKAEGYGKFSFVFAFVSLFAVVPDFGLSTLTIREVARNKSVLRKYLDNISVIKLILGVITFVLVIGIAQFVSKASSVKHLILLAAVWMVIQNFTQFFQSVFRAFEKMQYEALSKIIYSLFLFAISFFAIRKDLGIELIVQSFIYAALIAFIVTIILVRRKFTKFWVEIDLGFWKGLLKESWIIGAIMYLVTIYISVDQLFLAIFKEYADVGIYSVAYKFVMVIAIFSFILMNSLFPTISQFKDRLKIASFYNNNLKKIFLYALISCLSVFLLSKPMILLLFGKEYSLSFSVFKILVFAAFFEFFVFFGYTCLLAAGKTKTLLAYKAISAATNVCLNLLLIPLFGLYGAAAATVISYFELMVLNHITINKLK